MIASERKLISIVTVTYNDEWALSKTLRSIFSQSFNDYELIVVDGNSNDDTKSLIGFWQNNNLIDKYICEDDEGVYDAMNKGIINSSGNYVMFLNSGDTFYSNNTLDDVADIIRREDPSILMGWGELNGQLWSSWVSTQAFRLASLGFCHQSMYVKRSIIKDNLFDIRPFKTDSDIQQLANMIKENDLLLVKETLSVRSGDEGISANLEKTAKSIEDSILTSFSELKPSGVDIILSFRRHCEKVFDFKDLFEISSNELKEYLALIILDTLCQPQSKKLLENQIEELFKLSVKTLLDDEKQTYSKAIDNFLLVQTKRAQIAKSNKKSKNILSSQISELRKECQTKFGEYNKKTTDEFVVSLTSFPKRISSVFLVIESILRQTLRPSKIYLNIGKDEIKNENWLPSQLRALQKEGLVINFVDNTFHQYDKFMHNFTLNKSKPLVIIDDDVIYPPKSMEYLLGKSKDFPGCVVSNRPHKMVFNLKGNLLPYANWDKEVNESMPSHLLFPTGAGGVLYPVNFFDTDFVCNKSKLLKVAPYADDVWLKATSIRKGIKAVCSDMMISDRWYYRYTPEMEMGALHKQNVDLGMNDMQIQACFEELDIKTSVFGGSDA